jgi:hypothetical protein
MINILFHPKVLLADFIGLLIAAVIFLFLDDKSQRADKVIYRQNQEVYQDSVKHWRNDYNDLVTQRGVLTMSIQEMKTAHNSDIQQILKYQQADKIKDRKLEEASKTDYSSKDTGKVYIHDTTYIDAVSHVLKAKKTFEFGNQWLKANCAIIDSSVYWSYTYNVSIYRFDSWERQGDWTWKNIIPWNWRPKVDIVTLNSTDTNAVINILTIKKK